jgi:hypothetical protein
MVERMNRLVPAARALGVILLVACSCAHVSDGGDLPGTGRSNSDVARESRAKWEAADVSDYTWQIYVGCFCDSGTSTVKVVDGQPVDLRVDGEPSSIGSDREHGIIPLTMEDLFDVLDEAYAKHAEIVRVTYDADLGYPTDAFIDPNYGCADPLPGGKSCTVSDDEMQYTVKSFEVG